ncbi:hypothetical protein RRF57_000004 [Xylaria bambusicola]|uniref:DUF1308 domain-containing protein n=1 Tax=Xylaria bambusicola TaxID=326684 RepID=A0AAN7U9Y7_9PEZI
METYCVEPKSSKPRLSSSLHISPMFITDIFRNFLKPCTFHSTTMCCLRSKIWRMTLTLKILSLHTAYPLPTSLPSGCMEYCKDLQEYYQIETSRIQWTVQTPDPGAWNRIKDIMSQGGSEPKRNQNGRSARIDVICDGGLLWYKVSTITNRRLLFDMAKESIYCGDSDHSDSSNDTSQDLSDVPLVKMARTLKAIAQGHQIRNTTPTLCLVLPRIQEGEHVEVDKIVKFCRDMGVHVSCGNELPVTLPLSDDLLHEMVPSPKRNITSELNIDTSVLVALTSDISHFRVTPQSWFGQSQKDHIDLETHDPLIPQFCSLLCDHQLVCTKEAAASLARIVHTMGTATENARAHLLLTPDDTKTREQRTEEFRELSIHDSSIPLSLQLPIRVLYSETNLNRDICRFRLDASIQEKLNSLAQPGRSVFLSGWAKGVTTITCNVCKWVVR